MIIEKIKKNKACPNREARRGFVILFAVMISSMVLAIALGVTNIAFKEIKFSTSAKDTNEAFFAADTGAECALYYDKSSIDAFRQVEEDLDIAPLSPECAGSTNTLDFSEPTNPWTWTFTLFGLGASGKGCVNVEVFKEYKDGNIVGTTIISKGYNNGNESAPCVPNPNSVERELEVNY